MLRSARMTVQAALVAAGALSGLLCGAGAAQARGWQALVVGAPGPGAEGAFAAAYHVDDALREGGATDTTLLRDVGAGEVEAAAEALAGAPQVLIYLAGTWTAEGRLSMRARALDPAALLSDLAATGTQSVVLLVEDCAGAGGAVPFTPPVAPPGLTLFIAASAGPEGHCPAPTDILSARLTGPGARAGALSDLLGGLWQSGQSDAPAALFAAAMPAPAPQAPVVTVTASPADLVRITPVIAAPLAPGKAIAPTLASPEEASDPVLIFAPATQSRLVALPRAAGLPRPSIIVGLIDPPAQTGQSALRFDDLATREKLRSEDPQRFAQLVSTGALDPPADQLGRALQEELARMGCYTTTIDGVWGGGSRAAVERYFAERPGVQAVGFDPDPALFRQIIAAADVSCPAPRVATTVKPRVTPAPAQTRTNAPARVTPAAPAKPAAPTRKIQSGTALGVFR